MSLLNQGYQYLTEPPLRPDRRGAGADPARHQALGMPLRSLEVELGQASASPPSARSGLDAADPMIRSAPRPNRSRGATAYLASFMCRPALPNLFSCGWHLHQSLIERKRGRNVFAGDERDGLSATGLHFLGGLLAHARAATAFTTPTVNGYKRYRPYTLAPDRAIWARDNRGVMVRVLGQPGDPATHLENRIGEPAANPYLYMASQIYAGLDGMAHQRDPGPSADTPYETKAPMLPKDLGEAARRVARRARYSANISAQPSSTISRTQSDAEFARFKAEASGRRRSHRLGAERIFRFVLRSVARVSRLPGRSKARRMRDERGGY